MEEHFSSLGLTTGATTTTTNLPVLTIPVRQDASNTFAFLKNFFSPGITLAVLSTLLVLTLIASNHINQNTAIQSEVVSQVSMQHVRIAKAAQQAATGQTSVFSELQEHHNQLSHLIMLITQGGLYHDETVSPVSADLPALEDYLDDWKLADKTAQSFFTEKDSLVRFGSSMKAVSRHYNQFGRRIDELAARMTEVGHLSAEIKTLESIRVHVRDAVKNIQLMLSGEWTATEISAQLAQDRAQISIILQTLSQGRNGLAAASDKDDKIQDLLSHSYSLLQKLADNLNVIGKEITHAITIQSTSMDIANTHESMLNLTEQLQHELREQTAWITSTLNILFYGLIAGLAITLPFFIRSQRQKSLKQEILNHKQDLLSHNEIIQTQKAMQTLLLDMKKIADGDLTVRTDITHHMTGSVADAINCTIEELHTLVEQVNQASTLVVQASQQAQQVAVELLSAEQLQSEKIEESTIAVLGMSDSITEVSDMATESARVAKQSLAAAEKGASAVRETITGMNDIRTHIQDTSKRIKRLGESSQEIGEIVTLMTDITEQTNVLALNAALQATAAGEAGRGFTVIAQEVQRLAERSTEASKQISELILTIQHDTQDAIAAMERSTMGVTQGTQRSDSAGRALEEIEQVSKQLATLVTSIFEATSTQTSSANKVVANMEEILHITRQHTVGTRLATTSVKQITGFATELKASVANFKV